MRELGLIARNPKKFRNTSRSNQEHKPSNNLLKRKFRANAPNKVWVGDVTYVRTRSGWGYLALLMDMYCRTIVGWAVSTKCDENLTRRALEMAVRRRRPAPGLIHHTDRGATYTAKEYRGRIAQLGMKQSMSRRGDCWDNAPAESVNGTIKREMLEDALPIDASHLRSMAATYIDDYYNVRRLHSSIDFQAPMTKFLSFHAQTDRTI
jgi:transposase InsO family protein